MPRASKRYSAILYLVEASLKDLQYMEDLIKTQKTIKVLRIMRTIKSGSGKTKKWTKLYNNLPKDKKEWVEKEAYNHLIRIKKWQVTK